jgi:dTDP-4-amino-4,6-dideoxygalactose transaminase
VTTVEPITGLDNHQHVRYPVIVETPALRDDVQRSLADAGIQAPLIYDWPRIDGERFPDAKRLQDGILTLPTHPFVDSADRRTVVETIRSTVHSPAG